MSFFRLLKSLWQRQSVAELSRQIAGRTYPLVRETIDPQAVPIPRAEARGYIRAKATPVIRSQVKALLAAEGRLAAGLEPLLVAHAGERVVQSILADLSRDKARQAPRRAA
jgi:hypothetical protein